MGHYLGLLHPFNTVYGCSEPNDYVEDTPEQAMPLTGCPPSRDTCPANPGVDPVHNFMGYNDDKCLYEFTSGQILRMQRLVREYRPVLYGQGLIHGTCSYTSKTCHCVRGARRCFLEGGESLYNRTTATVTPTVTPTQSNPTATPTDVQSISCVQSNVTCAAGLALQEGVLCKGEACSAEDCCLPGAWISSKKGNIVVVVSLVFTVVVATLLLSLLRRYCRSRRQRAYQKGTVASAFLSEVTITMEDKPKEASEGFGGGHDQKVTTVAKPT
jgi:hypothetical protein